VATFTPVPVESQPCRRHLEMITHDPLKVPRLTSDYWEVFPERNGVYVAGMIKFVNADKSQSLPLMDNLPSAEHVRIEEDNVRICIRYASKEPRGLIPAGCPDPWTAVLRSGVFPGPQVVSSLGLKHQAPLSAEERQAYHPIGMVFR
jgi:hypothetical protein